MRARLTRSDGIPLPSPQEEAPLSDGEPTTPGHGFSIVTSTGITLRVRGFPYIRRRRSNANPVTGLASVFIEAPEVAQQRMTLPSVFNDQCAKMNMPYNGNVVGLNSTSNFKGEP